MRLLPVVAVVLIAVVAVAGAGTGLGSSALIVAPACLAAALVAFNWWELWSTRGDR